MMKRMPSSILRSTMINGFSYDDDVTLKQKVHWANGVGLGGALIWASDLVSQPGTLAGATSRLRLILLHR